MSKPFTVVPKFTRSSVAASEEQLTEARRSPRRAYDRPIGVLMHGSYNVFRALQLGEGGISFLADKKLATTQNASGETKDRLVVSIILPGVAEGIVARAEITYVKQDGANGFQYGVQFLEMPLHVRRIIRNYVTAKTQEEAELEREAHNAESADKHGANH